MSDSTMKSEYLGSGNLGKKAIEKDIRILSTLETNALIESFSDRTGLSREQFAVNQWGLPFIPIPFVRTGYGNVRIAPKNVSVSFFGHPIYWIEPELTKRRPNEGEQEWCIRMFFLIDAFGYWTEEVEFIDFLKVNGFSYDDAQIQTYHRIPDQNAETNKFPLLDESDLDTSLAEVQANYDEMLARCFIIQKEESMKMLQKQGIQYSFAKRALGENIHKWTVSYDDSDGVWYRVFFTRLSAIAEEYNSRAEKGDEIVSDLLRETREIYDGFVDVVNRYYHATSILELPVKASISGLPGGSSRISYIASAMSLANSKNNARKVVFEGIDDAIKKSFGRGNAGEGGYDVIIESMASIYNVAWNRLRLAFINYDRLRRGEEIFASNMEMLAEFQKKGSRSNDGLSSVLDQSFE